MDERAIEVGDRFEDKDWRNEGRIVEVVESLGAGRLVIRTEVHPKNPSAVGRQREVSAVTLRSRYRRNSR